MTLRTVSTREQTTIIRYSSSLCFLVQGISERSLGAVSAALLSVKCHSGLEGARGWGNGRALRAWPHRVGDSATGLGLALQLGGKGLQLEAFSLYFWSS